jgi:hypothetical protein
LPELAHAADAECGITGSGIPDGVIAPIDVAHIRKSLAASRPRYVATNAPTMPRIVVNMKP